MRIVSSEAQRTAPSVRQILHYFQCFSSYPDCQRAPSRDFKFDPIIFAMKKFQSLIRVPTLLFIGCCLLIVPSFSFDSFQNLPTSTQTSTNWRNTRNAVSLSGGLFQIHGDRSFDNGIDGARSASNDRPGLKGVVSYHRFVGPGISVGPRAGALILSGDVAPFIGVNSSFWFPLSSGAEIDLRLAPFVDFQFHSERLELYLGGEVAPQFALSDNFSVEVPLELGIYPFDDFDDFAYQIGAAALYKF